MLIKWGGKVDEGGVGEGGSGDGGNRDRKTFGARTIKTVFKYIQSRRPRRHAPHLICFLEGREEGEGGEGGEARRGTR